MSKCFYLVWRTFKEGLGNFRVRMSGELFGVRVPIPIEHYKSLCVAVVIWTTDVNTHTHTHAHSSWPVCSISSVSWSENMIFINCTCKLRRRLLTSVGAQLSLPFFSFLSSSLFPPSLSFSFLSFPLFLRPRLRGLGELLSSHSGFGRRSAAKRHFGAYRDEKNASGESSFSALYEIIPSAHKTQAFWRKNCKTEADVFHGCWSPEVPTESAPIMLVSLYNAWMFWRYYQHTLIIFHLVMFVINVCRYLSNITFLCACNCAYVHVFIVSTIMTVFRKMCALWAVLSIYFTGDCHKFIDW